MAKWKDKIKSWNPKVIKSSEVDFGRFRLCIHRHINYPKDTWLASCAYLFSCRELASTDLAKAKCQAKACLQTILKDALDEIEKEESNY